MPTFKYILSTQIHCGNFQEELHAPCYFQNMKFKLVHLLNTEIAKRNPQRHSLLFQAATFPFSQRFIISEDLPSPGVALNTETQLQSWSNFFSLSFHSLSNVANIAFFSLERNSWVYVLKDFFFTLLPSKHGVVVR